MTPEQLVRTLWRERAVAVLRTGDAAVAGRAMAAAVDGGFRILEFTLGCPDPYRLISRFAGEADLVVGAGTVMTVEQARRVIDAGARFVVSPVLDEEIVAVARQAGVAVMPGIRTPTEAVRAWRAGAGCQKLFPAPASGPEWVRACLGPLPFLRLVPTHGVTAENVGDWFAAGVWAVGFVGSLFDPARLERGDVGDVAARARRCLEAARAAERSRRGTPMDPFRGEPVPAPDVVEA